MNGNIYIYIYNTLMLVSVLFSILLIILYLILNLIVTFCYVTFFKCNAVIDKIFSLQNQK